MSDTVSHSSGKPPRSARGFAARLDKGDKGQICYIQTKDETGYDAFYFLLLKPEKEEAFGDVIVRPGMADLTDYGFVVASGYGRTPHKKACEKMKELFDIKPLELIAEAKKKRKAGE